MVKIELVRKQYMARASVLCVMLALVGCGVVGQYAHKGEREKYVEHLQEIISDAKKSPEFFIGHTITDSEEQCKREMVYLDDIACYALGAIEVVVKRAKKAKDAAALSL